MDLDSLLEDRAADAPSGEDLEYDSVFIEMELAAQPGEERQAGDEILAAAEPDWKGVSKAVEAVLARSHDLRAGVLLALSELRLRGFTGFAKGTGYIRGCLERHWETVHPQLDEDDDDDPTMRVNAVLALADRDTVLSALRRAPLTQSRTFGAISLRDIAVSEGEAARGEGEEAGPDAAAVAAAFKDTDEDWLRATREAVHASVADVAAIDAVFVERTPGQGPELDALSRLLRQAASRLDAALGEEGAAEAPEAEAGEEAAAAPAAAAARAAPPGAIASPADVRAAIDRIVAYYEQAEPSSPVPVLLSRARRLVGADFLTIVRDMASEGMENVRVVGGLPEEDDDD